MLRFINYDIVFQEVPNEVTLAINISGCPNHCKGCHSPHLMENRGQILDNEVLSVLLNRYNSITCVCFMGGDSNPKMVEELAAFTRKYTSNRVKTAWYSGKDHFPKNCSLCFFDFVKLGPYVERLGGLDSPTSNQRFYKIENGKMVDFTNCFIKKEKLYFLNLNTLKEIVNV